MGTPKAWLPFGNEYLLQRIVRTVAEAASPVVLASRRGMELPPLPYALETVFDDPALAGPLAGIAAGMIALQGKCDAVLVVACDHPFVKAAVFHRMIELLGDHNAVIPQPTGRLCPTLAVYRMSTLNMLEEMLSKGELRAQQFALCCNPRFVGAADLADIDPDLRSLCNVNNAVEYEAALKSADAPSLKGRTCEL
jgi:molybdopterin-guanine dinucleotide biosynthesis protein A